MPTGLEESARYCGGSRWIETRLFEVLGGWVVTTGHTGAKLMLDRHSSHHAWRARQWWDRLPVLADVDRDGICGPPSEGWREALDWLAARPDIVGRMSGAYRVALPRLWSRYRSHLGAADPVADDSSRRTLEIVAADLVSDWQEGEVVLQGLLTDPASVRAAAAAQVEVETRLLADPS